MSTIPITQNRIIICDPGHFQHTIQAMVAADKYTDFARTFVRLIELFSSYSTAELASGRRRTARLWADYHTEHSFYWAIQEEPSGPYADDQDTKTLLAGAMHYHQSDKTWGLHT